jgi:Family of unknown function (DUF6502)
LKKAKTDRRIEDSLLQLLLPVSRLLVYGGIGIDELIYAAKGAYLRAAKQAVAQQDGRVNISRLSVATGMTRKEVSALLSDAPSFRGTISRRIGQQRALRVLRGWLVDPRFHKNNGQPDELPYRGEKRSFALLVKEYGGDVTPKSVLRELERIEIVEVMETGALRLRTSRSRAAAEVHYKLSDLAKLFEDFVLAAIGSGPNTQEQTFFFKDSTVSSTADAAYFMRRFSRRAAAYVEDFEQWTTGRGSIKSRQAEAIRVGLGIYLLRSDQIASFRSRGNSAARIEVRPTRKRHS